MRALLAAVQIGATLGHFPFQSTSCGSVVEQLKQRAATTFCKRRAGADPLHRWAAVDPKVLAVRRVADTGHPVVVGIHIPVLSVFTIVVHALNRFPWNLGFTEPAYQSVVLMQVLWPSKV